ncbi:MAG: hypothetical protein NC543_09470 [bacterium]|nr:hypothetical protein [bacterium]MCM1375672.1 hypothetical protein [Muribaculum sp.]
MGRRIALVYSVLLCIILLLSGSGGNVAYAAGEETGESSFFGNVELLKQEDGNYVMQVTVVNRGKDFTGTVQVVFAGSIARNCAYNTEITLPSQGKKQFTITVPERAVETVKGLCSLNFLDEKGEVLQNVPLKNVFGGLASGITVGILSDDYSQLSYLDARGLNLDVRGVDYPLQLMELSGENLRTYLDGLYFLVIDQFDTSTLGQENIQAIQEWVIGGGWLILGTGAYAQQTLSGFDADFLDLQPVRISEPGEENILSDNAQRYSYYYSYQVEGIEFEQMAVAEFDLDDLYARGGFESSQNPAILLSDSYGSGVVTVYFCSLGDEEMHRLPNYMIRTMFEEVMERSSSSNFNGNSDMQEIGQRALANIDNRNTNVDFSWLKVLIAVYVVLVGPVLYLVLRRYRKSEWYWLGVPALGLVFIAGVSLFGQGAKVNGIRAYSVTVQRTDSSRMDTFLLAYRSGTRLWEVKLADDYDVAGPGFGGYYYRGSSSASDYYYTVSNGSQGLSVGIKPRENFESGYLYAGGRAEKKGNFTADALHEDSLYGGLGGAITNDTGYDLAYMAVWYEENLLIYSDVKAGEALDLKQAFNENRYVYRDTTASDVRDLSYSIVYYRSYGTRADYQQDDMAALIIGLGMAREARTMGNDSALIAGVVKNYDRAVAEKCNEIAYGCLYNYVGVEVGQSAAN